MLHAQIRIDYDRRIFGLLCALNCVGYDQYYLGSPPDEMHPLRWEIRARLAGVPAEVIASFREYFCAAPPLSLTPDLFPFWPRLFLMMEYALHLGMPPGFTAMSAAKEASFSSSWPQRATMCLEEVAPTCHWLRGLGPALADFWQGAQIQQLYDEFAPGIVAQAETELAQLSGQVEACLDYLDQPHCSRRIVIVPNVLQDAGTADMMELADTTYLIAGNGRVSINSIWHELCHVPVNAALMQHAALLVNSEPLLATVETKMQALGYWRADRPDTWRYIIEDTLVRAIGARLIGGEKSAAWLQNDMEMGFRFVSLAAETLAEVRERQGQPFDEAVKVFLARLVQQAN